MHNKVVLVTKTWILKLLQGWCSKVIYVVRLYGGISVIFCGILSLCFLWFFFCQLICIFCMTSLILVFC